MRIESWGGLALSVPKMIYCAGAWPVRPIGGMGKRESTSECWEGRGAPAPIFAAGPPERVPRKLMAD